MQLASVRRTLFNNNERQVYLTKLAKGIRGILESPSGLSDRDNYHEFCRLVARLKSNYQLSELIRLDDYSKLMGLLCEFTVQSLQVCIKCAGLFSYHFQFDFNLSNDFSYMLRF